MDKYDKPAAVRYGDQMYAGGTNAFDEVMGEWGWTDIAMGPQPQDTPWTGFNNMVNNPTAPQYTGPTTGQKGWPAVDPTQNPWNTAKAAMQARTQANKDKGLFRVMGDLSGSKGGMINPLGMKPWQEAAVTPTTDPVPKVRDVAPAASQLVARTAPVADVPFVSPMPTMPGGPAPIPTNQAEYAAAGTPYIKGTLWNQMADPANYVQSPSMEKIIRNLYTNRGKMM